MGNYQKSRRNYSRYYIFLKKHGMFLDLAAVGYRWWHFSSFLQDSFPHWLDLRKKHIGKKYIQQDSIKDYVFWMNSIKLTYSFMFWVLSFGISSITIIGSISLKQSHATPCNPGLMYYSNTSAKPSSWLC